jgi:hypothetical protein
MGNLDSLWRERVIRESEDMRQKGKDSVDGGFAAGQEI